MMWDGNGDPGGGWVMLALIVGVVVAVIVAIVFLARYLSRIGGTSSTAAVPPASTGGPESPRDILKRRYATGEIDRDEYLQTLGDLLARRARAARTPASLRSHSSSSRSATRVEAILAKGGRST